MILQISLRKSQKVGHIFANISFVVYLMEAKNEKDFNNDSNNFYFRLCFDVGESTGNRGGGIRLSCENGAPIGVTPVGDDVVIACDEAIPTDTPLPTSTMTNTPIPPTNTATATATATAVPPTNTATCTTLPPTATTTNTPILPTNTATNTPIPPTKTATATAKATAVPPTFTSTPTPTNTATNTPVPPSATHTPEPTETPTQTATAVSAPGVGVVGDSSSEPYQLADRGGPDSFAWTEIARDLRGVNFGSHDECIAANSGQTTAFINSQVAELTPLIQSGEIGTAIIWIGANDLSPMCDAEYTRNNYMALRNTMLFRLESGITGLMNAGLTPEDIYMVTQGDRGDSQPCSNAEQLSDLVDEVNEGVYDMANEHGNNVIDFTVVFGELSSYIINAAGDIQIDGHIVYNQECDEPDCFSVIDGHPNTVANGIAMNALFVDALGVERLTDNEIVDIAGLE